MERNHEGDGADIVVLENDLFESWEFKEMRDMGNVEGLKLEPNSRYRCTHHYKFGRRGTGIKAQKLKDSPFPNKYQMHNIRELALHST